MAAAFIAALLIEHAAWPGGGEAGLTSAEDGVRTFAAQQWCARHLAGHVLALNDALNLAKLNRKKVRALRTRVVCALVRVRSLSRLPGELRGHEEAGAGRGSQRQLPGHGRPVSRHGQVPRQLLSGPHQPREGPFLVFVFFFLFFLF